MSEEKQVDKKAEREAKKRQKKLTNAARDLRRKILRYCQDERFAPALAAGIPLYWDDFYTIENADEMDPNESFRFLTGCFTILSMKGSRGWSSGF